MQRLQKILAAAGVASRRKAEELISAGRVTVNGNVVTELGSKANPTTDTITVDGKPLQPAQQFVYLLLNKPKGYVTTVSDPEGRPTGMQVHGDFGERVYAEGCMAFSREGLLLMPADGALAQQLTKAASHVPKTYHVKISGKPSEPALQRLRNGVTIPLEDGRRVKLSRTKIHLLEDAPNPWYEITLIEGRNRQIRRMFEQVGHHVEKIKRVQLGSIKLDVPPGKFRRMTEKEVQALKNSSLGKSYF